MDELLEQFLIEGRELVQAASDDLLVLERDPADAARIDGAFRAVHTLKGSVGLFDFPAMATTLHAAEDVLSAVRAGRMPAAGVVLDALLNCISATDRWIEAIATAGALPADAAQESQRLRESLAACLGPKSGGQSMPMGETAEFTWLPDLLARGAAAGATGTTVALRYIPACDAFYLGNDPIALVRAIPDLRFLHLGNRDPWPTGTFDPFACNLRIEALSAAPLAAVREVFRFVPDQCVIVPAATRSQGPPSPVTADATTRTLRVEAARLDALADIAGELMVAGNQLAHLVASSGLEPSAARALGATQADINHLIRDMQRAVMRLRLQPLAGAFRRFPRLVRETAQHLDKQLVFNITGEDVEVDKATVDGLFEPLLHLLRNAVDHGIESPDARRGAGKPEAGRISLAASREGDRIAIVVGDDGAGVDLAKIRHAAEARGLLSDAAAADDGAAADLAFAPGISTAGTITEWSGRGVGMDAVRGAVEALGGRVHLTSQAGEGTQVRLSLPQMVITTTIMVVRAGGESFGVPIEIVRETVQIARSRILPVGDGFAFVLRDRSIPVLHLADLLSLEATAHTNDDARLLIIDHDGGCAGIELDGFGERMDVKLLPLSGLLAGMKGIGDAALLGDGRLLLILDLPALIG